MKFLIAVAFLIGPALADPSIECQNLFMQFKHPYTCCKYPMRKILDRDQNNCRLKCSAVNDQKCCLLNCKYRETGVYVNGEFNDQALLRLYENFMNVNGAGKYDRWMAVIERSIKKCERLLPPSDKIINCNIPEYVTEMIDCVNLMNYLDCPTLERTEQCLAAQDFVRTLDRCGKKRNGIVLITHEYWDFQLIDPMAK